MRRVKQSCLHLLPKQVQNPLDLTAHGWTAISIMTIQHGTEALNRKSEFAYTEVLSFNQQFPWQKRERIVLLVTQRVERH